MAARSLNEYYIDSMHQWLSASIAALGLWRLFQIQQENLQNTQKEIKHKFLQSTNQTPWWLTRKARFPAAALRTCCQKLVYLGIFQRKEKQTRLRLELLYCDYLLWNITFFHFKLGDWLTDWQQGDHLAAKHDLLGLPMSKGHLGVHLTVNNTNKKAYVRARPPNQIHVSL